MLKVLATVVRLTVMLSPAPADKVSPASDALSHAEVLISDQLNAEFPLLVSEKVMLELLNGPLTAPVALKPLVV